MIATPAHQPETPVGARKTRNTAAYYALFIILGTVAAVVGPSLGRLAEQTQTSLSMFSWVFVARSLGYMAGSLLGGVLYDRLSGHRVMGAGLAGVAVLLALVPVTGWFWLLMLVLFLLGLAAGILDLGGNTLLLWLHREKSGPFLNGLHLFFGLGSFAAPVILAQAILLSGGIRWGYWILALLALPVLAGVVVQPSPPHLVRQGAKGAGQVSALLVGLIMTFFFAYVGAERAIGDWIASYAQVTGLADEVNAAYLTSFFWAAMTIGRLLGIPITARLRPRTVLLIDLAVSLMSIGLILILSSSWLAVQVGTWGLGLSMASIYPSMLTFAGNHMAISGRIASIFFVGSGLGGMFSSWLIGRIIEPLGPQAVLIAILTNLLLALGLFTAMLRAVAPAAPNPSSTKA